MMKENFKDYFEAAKNTFSKAGGENVLEGETIKETNDNFVQATRKLWNDFAVSGVLQFDKEKGQQVLQQFSDLDGKSALAILNLAGIDTQNLSYVRPGEFKPGAINLDTGDKFGVEYDENSQTTFFDHHKKGTKEATSTAQIVYLTMDKLGMLDDKYREDKALKSALKKLVDFVTKIDNRQYPAEEFLKSYKTILGLQRDVNFDKLLNYFKDYESPTEELTPEEFEKYGLKDSALKQKQLVHESILTLEKMEKEGKVINTQFGHIVINTNGELKTGASAAYVKFDGIINFTPTKSFAVTLKNKDFSEEELKNKLGEKFQGKIIRGKMWLYNDPEPLRASLDDIIAALS